MSTADDNYTWLPRTLTYGYAGSLLDIKLTMNIKELKEEENEEEITYSMEPVDKDELNKVIDEETISEINKEVIKEIENNPDLTDIQKEMMISQLKED
jgi:hypothetical protein